MKCFAGKIECAKMRLFGEGLRSLVRWLVVYGRHVVASSHQASKGFFFFFLLAARPAPR